MSEISQGDKIKHRVSKLLPPEKVKTILTDTRNTAVTRLNETLPSVSETVIRNITAVSYTHLDVYKRQT